MLEIAEELTQQPRESLLSNRPGLRDALQRVLERRRWARELLYGHFVVSCLLDVW